MATHHFDTFSALKDGAVALAAIGTTTIVWWTQWLEFGLGSACLFVALLASIYRFLIARREWRRGHKKTPQDRQKNTQ